MLGYVVVGLVTALALAGCIIPFIDLDKLNSDAKNSDSKDDSKDS